MTGALPSPPPTNQTKGALKMLAAICRHCHEIGEWPVDFQGECDESANGHTAVMTSSPAGRMILGDVFVADRPGADRSRTARLLIGTAKGFLALAGLAMAIVIGDCIGAAFSGRTIYLP